MKKKNFIKIGLVSLLVGDSVIASGSDPFTETGEKPPHLKGWLHTPGYAPPLAERTQSSSVVVEEEGPLLYDPARKLYYRPKRGSSGSVASGSSVEIPADKK